MTVTGVPTQLCKVAGKFFSQWTCGKTANQKKTAAFCLQTCQNGQNRKLYEILIDLIYTPD